MHIHGFPMNFVPQKLFVYSTISLWTYMFVNYPADGSSYSIKWIYLIDCRLFNYIEFCIILNHISFLGEKN